jgi:threonine synthase
MNYLSTRGAGAGERHTFSEILLGGLAKDGGLYLPADYPRVSADELTRWRTLPYADLAFEILSKFSDDIPAEDLRALTRKTYTAATYSNVRDDESAAQITPLKTLGVENGAPLSLLELSNGPTLAFKDMAMQLLGNLFEYTLAKHGQTLNILGATSGDTGISIDALLQKESEQVDVSKKGETDIILITHETVEKNVNAAIANIEALKTVVSKVTKLRMEALN